MRTTTENYLLAPVTRVEDAETITDTLNKAVEALIDSPLMYPSPADVVAQEKARGMPDDFLYKILKVTVSVEEVEQTV